MTGEPGVFEDWQTVDAAQEELARPLGFYGVCVRTVPSGSHIWTLGSWTVVPT